MELWKVKSRN